MSVFGKPFEKAAYQKHPEPGLPDFHWTEFSSHVFQANRECSCEIENKVLKKWVSYFSLSVPLVGDNERLLSPAEVSQSVPVPPGHPSLSFQNILAHKKARIKGRENCFHKWW